MIESVVLPAVGNMVTNVIQNSVSGFVEAGSRTIGGYAGDFIIRGGDIIENAGRGVGNNIALRGEAWGQSIKGYYGPQSKVRPMPIRSKSTSFLTPASSIIPRTTTSSTPKKGLPPAPKKPTTTGTTASTTQARSTASSAPIRARTAVKTSTTGPKPIAAASAASKPPASAATASKANVPIVATTAINPAAKRSTASSAPLKKVVPQKQSLPQAAKKSTSAASKPAGKPTVSNSSIGKTASKQYSHIPIGGLPTGKSSAGSGGGAAKKPASATGGTKTGSASAKKDDVLAPKKYDFF